MNSRITEIHFDRMERPFRAVIRTSQGVVEIQWRDIAGDRCWFSNGTVSAKQLAMPAIERLNRMVAQLDPAQHT